MYLNEKTESKTSQKGDLGGYIISSNLKETPQENHRDPQPGEQH